MHAGGIEKNVNTATSGIAVVIWTVDASLIAPNNAAANQRNGPEDEDPAGTATVRARNSVGLIAAAPTNVVLNNAIQDRSASGLEAESPCSGTLSPSVVAMAPVFWRMTQRTTWASSDPGWSMAPLM